MEIKHDKEARDLLIEGVNDLNNVVSKTMGPNGSTVIIPNDKEYGKYIVTKDGVSVAKATKFKNPIKNIGAKLCKEAAELTVKEAGDGTTTATVLTTAFVNNLKDFEYNDIEKAFNEIIPKVINELEKNSRKLSIKDIVHVAKISANNDDVIANKIQEAYNHSEVVKIEESNNTTDSLELISGMSLLTGYMSKNFETNQNKAVSELDKPKVLIIDGKIENLKPIETVINTIASLGESLLIIVEHVNDNILKKLEAHVLSGNIKLSIMKSPGFSSHRKNLLQDLAMFTNTKVVYDLNTSVSYTSLGKLQSVSLTNSKSILVKDKNIDISDYIKIIDDRLSIEVEDYNKELLKQRLDNLKGGVSIIKVGGKTETEMKERFDRYDDAVRAVACALEEGIVEGGGMALNKSIHSFLDFNKELEVYKMDLNTLEGSIAMSLLSPHTTIMDNGKLFCISKSMFEQNIIDPLKVTRTALLNAVAVAKTILSTKAVVLHESEWEN